MSKKNDYIYSSKSLLQKNGYFKRKSFSYLIQINTIFVNFKYIFNSLFKITTYK